MRIMTALPILCVGALIADLMMQLPALPRAHGKYLPKAARLVAAGMAASAATAVIRLGHPVALWASAGEDAIGDFLVGEMVKDGIDISHIRRLPGTTSAISTILVDDRGERIVVPYYGDVILSDPERVPPFETFSALLADVRWPAATVAALTAAKANGIPAILDLDVGSRDILSSLLPLATHVVASLHGASVVVGDLDLSGAVAALFRQTSATVVVTNGELGASWMEPGDTVPNHQPAFPVNAVDTNAAGDVFHGAFAVGLAEKMPMPEIMRFASAAAAIKCTRHGGRTGAPTRAEADAFLASQPFSLSKEVLS